MKTKPLNVGVIGCGAHGRGHVAGYGQLLDACIVAVADADLQRAKQVAVEFGVEYHYVDYRDMLAHHPLDIVSLALPPALNPDAALAAFAVGAHVMASKPLAVSLAQAEKIITTARSTGKLLTMGLQNRCLPEVQALRRIIANGRLGRVYHARLWHGHVMHVPPTPTMYQRALAGGGVLFHTMIHLLDAVLWALGNPRPVRATASSYRKFGRMSNPPATWEGPVDACDIEDFNVGLVHFADGSTMSLESNWLMHPRTRQSGAELLGDWGVAGLRPLSLELEQEGEIIDATPELPANPPDAFGQICLDFCQSIRQNRTPLVRFGEMLNVQRIMDTLYRAADSGHEVKILT